MVPFFCVQGAGRGEFLYKEAATLVGEGQPFYELRTTGLVYESVAELATQLADEVERVQPEGPLQLGGWSFGGLVAFELVSQLLARKRKVVALVLLDWVVSDMAQVGYTPQLAAIGALVRSVEASSSKALPADELAAVSARFAEEGFESSLEHMLGPACALLVKHDLLTPEQGQPSSMLPIVQEFVVSIQALLDHGTPDVTTLTQAKVPILAMSSGLFGLDRMERFKWKAHMPKTPSKNNRGGKGKKGKGGRGGKKASPRPEAQMIRHFVIKGADHWQMLRAPAVQSLAKELQRFLASQSSK